MPPPPDVQTPRPLADFPREARAAVRYVLCDIDDTLTEGGRLPAAAYAALERLQSREARWFHLHASILAGFGRVEEAIPLWQRAVALAPDYLPAQIRLGDSLTKANRNAEATRVYEDSLRRVSDNPYALLGLARLDTMHGNWTSARARLEKAIQADPDCIGALSLLITVHEHDRRSLGPFGCELVDVLHSGDRALLPREPARIDELRDRGQLDSHRPVP